MKTQETDLSQEIVEISKALSDPSRVAALVMVRDGERCACELVEHLGLAYPTVSRHMAVLKAAGLVVSRKEGRWHYFRLPRRGLQSPAVADALRWVMKHTGN